jgi:hypothetical protein
VTGDLRELLVASPRLSGSGCKGRRRVRFTVRAYLDAVGGVFGVYQYVLDGGAL